MSRSASFMRQAFQRCCCFSCVHWNEDNRILNIPWHGDNFRISAFSSSAAILKNRVVCGVELTFLGRGIGAFYTPPRPAKESSFKFLSYQLYAVAIGQSSWYRCLSCGLEVLFAVDACG